MVVWSILIAYLLGSIPFGLICGFLIKGVDIRQHGSGNLGATNVFRVIGKRWGICVLVLDALKGAMAVLVARYLLSASVIGTPVVVAGVTAIMGHAFPIWLRFKGGKGVATSLGVFLALAFIPTASTFGIWILVFATVRIISVASLVAAFTFPLVLFVTCRSQEIFPFLFAVSLLLLAFIVYTHRSNIKRLLRGEEKRLL